MKSVALGLFLFGVLTLQISAQSILQKGKIPEDLVITLSLSGTIEFAAHYDYKIDSAGKVFYEERSNLPPLTKFADLLGNKSKKPKLKDKFSKKQIKQIILEFEKSGFFEMNEYYEGDPALIEATCVNHAETKSLSISANGKTKKVGFFLGCSYGEKSPLKSFLSLFDKISGMLQGVKVISMK